MSGSSQSIVMWERSLLALFDRSISLMSAMVLGAVLEATTTAD